MDLRQDIPLYPGGKRKAFTLSYDDGVVQDKKFLELCKQYSLKATFNLNSSSFGQTDYYPHLKVAHRKIEKEDAVAFYEGFEVACHSLHHPDLSLLDTGAVCYEVMMDRYQLETLFGKQIRGFAYPMGNYTKETLTALHSCGIRYARPTAPTYSFALPENFLAWHPTCHHKDQRLFQLAEQFLEGKFGKVRLPIFYVWGHTYEFENDDNWEVIEQLFQLVSGKEDIWYATNGEIYRYVQAWHQLEYSADQSMIYNPTLVDIWLEIFGKTYKIPAGEQINVQ
ncbi:MAG: polysaccharide deacetylase family protein [Lachnospiraceae bacterium]